MPNSFGSCFDYAFRYTYFSFLPPFVTPSRYYLGYFSVSVYLFLFIRAILTVTEEGKTDFEIFYMIIITFQIGANALIYVLQYEGFKKFSVKIDEFLEENPINFANKEGIKVIEIWDKEKPLNFAKWNFWYHIIAGSVWILILDYNLLYYVEKSADSPFPYYSPFINWGGNYKWIHITTDSVVMLHVLLISIQADIALVSLLKFLLCQFIYLEILLEGLFGENPWKRNDESNRIWIEKHVKVIDLATEMNDLLKPHIMMKYLGLVVAIIFDIMMLTQENSKMTFFQKVIELFVVVMMFSILGYECRIADRLSETHHCMYQCLLQEEVIGGKEREVSFLKMLILRCQRPIKISDYGFFIMDGAYFKTLVVHTYEYYSALVSVARKKAHK